MGGVAYIYELWATLFDDTATLKQTYKERQNANAQNSTFASPDTKADPSAYKRAVFLPTHRQKILSLNFYK